MSFAKRATTPNYSKLNNLTEVQDHYNTFNTFNKANYSSFRDKIQHKNKYKPNYNAYNAYIPNPYNSTTFFSSSAPFNYYNKSEDKNGLLICYNGGPRKKYNPLIQRANLSQYLKNRSKTLKYKRPCGCYSNYYSSKYMPEYDYSNFERSPQLPNISGNNNLRYSYDNMTPRIDNRKKITYKLKDNFDNSNNRLNTVYNINGYFIPFYACPSTHTESSYQQYVPHLSFAVPNLAVCLGNVVLLVCTVFASSFSMLSHISPTARINTLANMYLYLFIIFITALSFMEHTVLRYVFL